MMYVGPLQPQNARGATLAARGDMVICVRLCERSVQCEMCVFACGEELGGRGGRVDSGPS